MRIDLDHDGGVLIEMDSGEEARDLVLDPRDRRRAAWRRHRVEAHQRRRRHVPHRSGGVVKPHLYFADGAWRVQFLAAPWRNCELALEWCRARKP